MTGNEDLCKERMKRFILLDIFSGYLLKSDQLISKDDVADCIE